MAKLKKQLLQSKSKLKKHTLKSKKSSLAAKLKKVNPRQLQEAASIIKLEKTALENETEESPATNFVSLKRDVNEDQIRRGVSALLEYIEKVGKKTVLFDDELPIYLQVLCMKVPNCPYRQLRFTLPHSLLINASQEVCLIVRDVGKPKEHEETIEHFEKLLQEHGITNIKTIIPFHQFKTEYGTQFELKRKMLGLYDHFLVDGRISGYVVHLLGKIFSDKRKTPTAIRMDSKNLKQHIDVALKKTIMKIHSKGDSFAVQVGHNKMSQEEIYDNLLSVIDNLSSEFPGGFENVRFLGIKTDKSVLVPIYLTLRRRSTIMRPKVIATRPKHCKEVKGELTTYARREVTVLPSGEIVTHDIPVAAKSDPDSLEQEEEEDLNEETFVQTIDEDIIKNEESMEIKKDISNSNSEVEEEEDILAQAEEDYLNEYEEEVKLVKKENVKQKKLKTEQEVDSKNKIKLNKKNKAVSLKVLQKPKLQLEDGKKVKTKKIKSEKQNMKSRKIETKNLRKKK